VWDSCWSAQFFHLCTGSGPCGRVEQGGQRWGGACATANICDQASRQGQFAGRRSVSCQAPHRMQDEKSPGDDTLRPSCHRRPVCPLGQCLRDADGHPVRRPGRHMDPRRTGGTPGRGREGLIAAAAAGPPGPARPPRSGPSSPGARSAHAHCLGTTSCVPPSPGSSPRKTPSPASTWTSPTPAGGGRQPSAGAVSATGRSNKVGSTRRGSLCGWLPMSCLSW